MFSDRQKVIEDESHCPSCGRFVGPKEICPHCGAKIKKRLSIRLVKRLSIICGIVGLSLLYLVSIKTKIPTVKIENITPIMNFAIVGVKGVVAGELFKKEGYISFLVSDGTGEILVKAYGSVIDNIYPLPNYGDSIELVGTIQITEQRKSIIANAADRIWVKSRIPVRDIGSIYEQDIGAIIRIKGRVKSYKPIRKGTLIWIGDETGEIKAVKWGKVPMLWPGRAIECIGEVKLYRGEVEIVVREMKIR